MSNPEFLSIARALRERAGQVVPLPVDGDAYAEGHAEGYAKGYAAGMDAAAQTIADAGQPKIVNVVVVKDEKPEPKIVNVTVVEKEPADREQPADRQPSAAERGAQAATAQREQQREREQAYEQERAARRQAGSTSRWSRRRPRRCSNTRMSERLGWKRLSGPSTTRTAANCERHRARPGVGRAAE